MLANYHAHPHPVSVYQKICQPKTNRSRGRSKDVQDEEKIEADATAKLLLVTILANGDKNSK